MSDFDTNRALLEITGDDRASFLQGIVTQDVSLLGDARAIFAAMLSPQGKILHDFFLIQHHDTILLDCFAAHKETLIKRLTMYKLRAKVAIRDATEWRVGYRLAAECATVGHVARSNDTITITDPRAAEMGERIYTKSAVTGSCKLDEYHAHRLALGIPDTTDLAEDTLLDAGYDLLNAVSFTKGCFVGQEVTARMHYRNIARRGFYIVTGEAPLPPAGTPVTADGITLGTLRGSLNHQGIAILKFEEVEQAEKNKLPIIVDNKSVKISAPAWLAPKLALFHAERERQ